MATNKVYGTPGQMSVFAAAAAAWVTSTVYAVGIVVTNSSSSYFCLTAHTSGTFATDLAAGKWVLVTATTFTPAGVATGAGRVSNSWNRGSGSQPMRYLWRLAANWVATPTAGDALRVYLLTSVDGATAALSDGGIAPTDAAISSENQLLYDCMLIGAVISDGTAAIRVTSGIVNIFSQYVYVAIWNAGAKSLTSTASDTVFTLVPVPDDIQAAS